MHECLWHDIMCILSEVFHEFSENICLTTWRGGFEPSGHGIIGTLSKTVLSLIESNTGSCLNRIKYGSLRDSFGDSISRKPGIRGKDGAY